jgi:hypothetical protein
MEIISVRLAQKMIFSLRARGRVDHVGFYTIPYNQACVVNVGSSNAGKHNFHAFKNLITYEITSYVRDAERPLDGC